VNAAVVLVRGGVELALAAHVHPAPGGRPALGALPLLLAPGLLHLRSKGRYGLPRLLLSLLEALDERGHGHGVVVAAQLDQVSRVGQERGVKPPAPDATLGDDVVPLGRSPPASGDAAPTGLLRHPRHTQPRAAWAFNPPQVVHPIEKPL